MYLNGLQDEDLVMSLISDQLNGICTKATIQEDRRDHIDFHCLLPDGEHLDVDVKGLRKHSRTDSHFDDTIAWVEFKNVKGDVGWLYGKASHIAFVTNTQVIFIKRSLLAAFAEKKMGNKEIVHSLPHDCYVPYQRQGRQDIIMKVLISDLSEIYDFILKK